MILYAVSYVNLLENELSITFVEAEDEIEAVRQRLTEEEWQAGDGDFDTLEELKEFMFTLDVLVDAVEVEEVTRLRGKLGRVPLVPRGRSSEDIE